MGFEAWPAEAAQKIKDEAMAAEMPDGVEMVEKLAKIVMGDAALVESYAEVWAPQSQDALSEVQDKFNAHVTTVNDVWTGTAADEFKAWAVKYNTAIRDCKEAMKGPQDALWKCSNEITKTYSEAIKMIGRVAAALVDATTGVIGIPINMLGLVGELIAAFITEATTLIGDALVHMQGYRDAMARMRGSIAALANLVPMGHVVDDPAGWQPRPAPAG